MRQIKFDVRVLGGDVLAQGLLYEREAEGVVKNYLRDRGLAGERVEPLLHSGHVVGFVTSQMAFEVVAWEA